MPQIFEGNFMNHSNTIAAEYRGSNTTFKRLSLVKTLCLFLFFGTFIGDLIVLILWSFQEVHWHELTEYENIKFVLLVTLLSYPFALFIGGVPALISGFVIYKTNHLDFKHLRAFMISVTISVLFYGIYFHAFSKSEYKVVLFLSLVGGAAALATQHLVQRIEQKQLKKHKA